MTGKFELNSAARFHKITLTPVMRDGVDIFFDNVFGNAEELGTYDVKDLRELRNWLNRVLRGATR